MKLKLFGWLHKEIFEIWKVSRKNGPPLSNLHGKAEKARNGGLSYRRFLPFFSSRRNSRARTITAAAASTTSAEHWA